MKTNTYLNAYYAAKRNRFKTLFGQYKKRVIADGGLVKSDDITKAYMKMAQEHRMDDIAFGWLGDAGSTIVDGKVSKLYSLENSNDATQPTEANRPYITGNIAPNEHSALNNPNGNNKYVTHPTISFAAVQAWSITMVFNFNGSVPEIYSNLFGSSSSSNFFIDANSGVPSNIYFYNADESHYVDMGDGKGFVGKTNIFTLIADGSGNLKLYTNGVLFSSKSVATDLILSRFLGSGRTYGKFQGKIYTHVIRPQALTQQQVTAEYNFLSAIYPEIPSVVIGTQQWATSSLEQVCNNLGTLIPNGSLTENWILGTAFWCYNTANNVIGKLYNKEAKLIINAGSPEGWHVPLESELTTLALNGGYALKHNGTEFWNTTGGTNTTGFTALGLGSRNADGSFTTYKDTSSYWCADSDKVLMLNHADNTAVIVSVSPNSGHQIRLIKD